MRKPSTPLEFLPTSHQVGRNVDWRYLTASVYGYFLCPRGRQDKSVGMHKKWLQTKWHEKSISTGLVPTLIDSRSVQMPNNGSGFP